MLIGITLYLYCVLWEPPLILLNILSSFTLKCEMTVLCLYVLQNSILSAKILAFYPTEKVGATSRKEHTQLLPLRTLSCLHLYPHIFTSFLVPYLRPLSTPFVLDLISSFPPKAFLWNFFSPFPHPPLSSPLFLLPSLSPYPSYIISFLLHMNVL